MVFASFLKKEILKIIIDVKVEILAAIIKIFSFVLKSLILQKIV